MITRMDTELGRVLDQLKAMKALDDTMILFVSDNGASSEQLIRNDGHDPNTRPGSGASHLCLGPGWAGASNTPFRLHKSWVHEGGISSPMIAHWPAGIRDKGKIRHTPTHFVEVVPTLIDLAGGNAQSAGEGAPPFAGRSFAPAFEKHGTIQREWLYFNHSNNRALRMGEWKIVAAGKDAPWEMYDLRRDRGEQKNVIAEHPAKAQEMAAIWQRQDADFVRSREAAPPSSKAKL